MAALHQALKVLAPIEASSIPSSPEDLAQFMTSTFADAQLLIDSIPLPTTTDTSSLLAGRSRSNTVSSIASSVSDISISTARSTPPHPDVEILQKEWGKPVRLNAKDNPLGMSVYKLAGNDGKGAWFARRSVHEGLAFGRWKRGLEREFPETLKVQGGPGEGNIRGIGGERRIEHKAIHGVGKLEVYHLSAQFPGPTTPRDFVTLLLTSDKALTERTGGTCEEAGIPRHFMVVSKPCTHPEAPERSGFIRGHYQSVEIIREVPVNPSRRKSASTNDLLGGRKSRKRSGSTATPLGREAILRNAKKAEQSSLDGSGGDPLTNAAASNSDTNLAATDSAEGRRRGKTISFSSSRGIEAKGEHFNLPEEDGNGDNNPVEWIMLTRSDPGGSVPRFMVERGTPGSIVADASKFLNWACSTEDSEDELSPPSSPDLEPLPITEDFEGQDTSDSRQISLDEYKASIRTFLDDQRDHLPLQSFNSEDSSKTGVLELAHNAAAASSNIVVSHAPAVATNHIPGYNAAVSSAISPTYERRRFSSSSSSSSSDSFASALSGVTQEGALPSDAMSAGELSIKSASSSPSLGSHVQSAADRELQRLQERKRKLNEKLDQTREREKARKTEDGTKEAQAVARAEEKHAKEIARHEERYAKEMARLKAKREKEERKAEEKRRRLDGKEERQKLERELERAKLELQVVDVERDILRRQVGDLQRENTALAVGIGRLGEMGKKVLEEARAVVGKDLRATGFSGRDRSGSVRSEPRGMGKENEKPVL